MNTRFIKQIKKYLLPLFNTRAAGLYILLFAAAIGIATFIENDYGTSSAQKVVFKARWFELLLLLFSITLIVNMIKFRMIQNKKWTLLLFHGAMIIILIGSGVTRYFGFEGMMHIREGADSNSFMSANTYLQFEVIKDNNKYRFDEPVLFATLGNNNWSGSYLIGNDLIEVDVNDFIPNPSQVLEEIEGGLPTLKIVFGSSAGREEYFISEGESKRIKNVQYHFKEGYNPDAVNITYEDSFLYIQANRVLTQMVMATQERDTLYPDAGRHVLRLRSLYSDGDNQFVFGDFKNNSRVILTSDDPKVKGESMTALVADVSFNGEKKETIILGKKGLPGRPAITRFDGMSMAIKYGAKPINLPFKLKLYDFIMERYPGTNSAMSYASEVQVIDDRKGIRKDYRIFMNHILDHDGYRFFQSSFDKDEQGTYLSVNHDFWGTWISYIGYVLLTLGMVLTFVSKKTRFYEVRQKIKKIRSQSQMSIIVLALLSISTLSYGQKIIEVDLDKVSLEHADLFSQVIVQDHKGRMKPMHTLTREVLRKIARKESIAGQSADQVILSMYANKQSWINIPMIKIGHHKRLHDILGAQGDFAAYKDFFNTQGAYKLRDEVRRAYGLQPIDRGTFEKELLKVDERLNIASMIYSGRLFRIIPIVDDPNNTWIGAKSHGKDHGAGQSIADRFFSTYKSALHDAIHSGNYSDVNSILIELKDFQKKISGDVIPSDIQLKAELALNKLNVFGRLALFYSVFGICFLVLLFYSVFKPKSNLNKIFNILFVLVIVCFAFHTLGLGLRWYVAERAPWSNGYESMIYIAWTTTLAGLLFTKKSTGGLAATMILAGTILLVAMLSYLDPEITPLVPVLRSYWLTIHVSLEAGSYGFLMLGAIIGLINLILMIFLTENNKELIKSKVKELSYISELTLMGGLVMVSVGTYLGGVWANESWGRYWGWDAKETWALVTILVYAFILHMRIIPKLQGLFIYNFATLFGWASVIMTYYGVNYYLSGLHSYAAGDPVPIPAWVYISVVVVGLISLMAFIRSRKFKLVR